MTKFLLGILTFASVCCVGLTANRQCYGCSDFYPQYFNGTKCSDGLLKMKCTGSDQSCTSVTFDNKQRTKACLVDQNNIPYSLPDGCFSDSLGRYILVCNKDYCNDKDRCANSKFIRSSFEKFKIVAQDGVLIDF